MAKRNTKLTGEAFDALSAEEKERIYHELDSMTPQQLRKASKPISASEWAAMHRPTRKHTGRPKLGRHGVKVIAVSLEKDLLARVDRYAKETHTKRSKLIARALQSLIDAKAAG